MSLPRLVDELAALKLEPLEGPVDSALRPSASAPLTPDPLSELCLRFGDPSLTGSDAVLAARTALAVLGPAADGDGERLRSLLAAEPLTEPQQGEASGLACALHPRLLGLGAALSDSPAAPPKSADLVVLLGSSAALFLCEALASPSEREQKALAAAALACAEAARSPQPARSLELAWDALALALLRSPQEELALWRAAAYGEIVAGQIESDLGLAATSRALRRDPARLVEDVVERLSSSDEALGVLGEIDRAFASGDSQRALVLLHNASHSEDLALALRCSCGGASFAPHTPACSLARPVDSQVRLARFERLLEPLSPAEERRLGELEALPEELRPEVELAALSLQELVSDSALRARNRFQPLSPSEHELARQMEYAGGDLDSMSAAVDLYVQSLVVSRFGFEDVLDYLRDFKAFQSCDCFSDDGFDLHAPDCPVQPEHPEHERFLALSGAHKTLLPSILPDRERLRLGRHDAWRLARGWGGDLFQPPLADLEDAPSGGPRPFDGQGLDL